MKKIVVMMFSSAIFASAESADAQTSAEILNQLGMFKGTGTDENGNPIYDLEKNMTRYEAVTMLVRMLGKEEEAIKGSFQTPFLDLEDWAKPYVGYAYTNKLTSGTSDTTYSGEEFVTPAQYLTFVLRALGYTSGKDFEWDKSFETTDLIGITDGRFDENTENFTRGDAAIVSNNALGAEMYDGSMSLFMSIANSELIEAQAMLATAYSFTQALVDGLTEVQDMFLTSEEYSKTEDANLYDAAVLMKANAKKALGYLETAKKLSAGYIDLKEVNGDVSRIYGHLKPFADYELTEKNAGGYFIMLEEAQSLYDSFSDLQISFNSMSKKYMFVGVKKN